MDIQKLRNAIDEAHDNWPPFGDALLAIVDFCADEAEEFVLAEAVRDIIANALGVSK